ncbi:MAG: glycosyltransferase family 39 protein [Bdellovibrionota bacterium]
MSSRPLVEKIAFFFFIVMTLVRLVLAARLGLGDDEAYYWDWSRSLSLSYFDHPAMVAWLIKAGTLLFGDTPFGVRVFGLLSGGLAGVLLWWLARELFDRRIAALTLLLYTFAPIFAVGGFLMVPDAPMAFAWTAFTCILWKLWGSSTSRTRDWILAGLVLGFGLLSKYTMLLAAVSAVALFLSDRARRRDLVSSRFFLTITIVVAMCVPILAWNHVHEWPSVKFHLHDRQTGGGGPSLLRWLQFWASQFFVLGPVLFVVCMMALVAAFRRRSESRWKFIALVSAPPLVVFAIQALFAEFKAHWPAPAFPLLFIGASALWTEWKPISRKIVAGFVVAFFALTDGIFYISAVHPILPTLSRLVNPAGQFEPQFDPTNDLYGWDELVAHLRPIREKEKASTGKDVLLSAGRYQLVSQFAFASGEEVLRAAKTTDHYSFTQTPEKRAALKGADAIFVSDNRFYRDPRTDGTFETCHNLDDFKVKRGEEPARIFYLWICRGFKGA